MKDLMQKVMTFITFDFPVQATYINIKFAETHQKLQTEVPEWSSTATRQKLLFNYWSNHVAGHFTFLFGLPSLVFFFVSGGFHDFSGYLVTIMIAGMIIYFVFYLFHYRPIFCTSYLPSVKLSII